MILFRFMLFFLIFSCGDSSIFYTASRNLDGNDTKPPEDSLPDNETPSTPTAPSIADGNFGDNTVLLTGTISGVSIRPWTDAQRRVSLTDPTFGSSILALWHLEDNTTVSIDSGSGGHDLTPNGVVSNVPGQIGSGLSLAGNGNLAVSSLLGSPASLTISTWFLHTGADTNGSEIISLGDNFALRANRSGSGGLGIGLMYRSGGYDIFDTNLRFETSDGWVHMVKTFDDANDRAKIYVNGRLIADYSNSFSIEYSRGTATVLGAHGDGNGTYDFSGSIDETIVWNKVLSAEEVNELYLRQKGSYGGGRQSEYISDYFDNVESKTWTSLSVVPYAPYRKPLQAVSETAYSENNLDVTDLVGFWHFDGVGTLNNGDSIDGSGLNTYSAVLNDANMSGVSYQSNGKFNQSLLLDGVDDFFESTLNYQLSAGEPFSFSGWFKGDTPPPDGDTFYPVVSINHGTSNIAMLAVGNRSGVCSDNCAFFYFRSGSTNNASTTEKVINLTDGRWHFLVGGRRANGDLFISVDGRSSIVGDNNGNAISGADVLSFGSNSNAADFVEGEIDEISVWSKALSDAEIQSMYSRSHMNAKFQVRACENTPCTGAWIGPDGTSSSFFDEQLNQTSSLPVYDLSSLNLTGRYFQYRLLLETGESDQRPIIESVVVN